MAKRWKREEDEEIEIPPFDKREHIQEEMRKVRIHSVYSGAGLLAGLLSGLSHSVSPLLGLLFGMGILAFLIISSRGEVLLNLPVKSDKDIIGSSILFFLGWLGMWTVLINPPFAG
jgi:hypothetical protein